MKPNVIAHIDMDAFFAAVEQRDHPAWLGKPVIVGADPKGGKGRGVVSTCSYEARKFGVHSAQPISTAYRLCPQGIYTPVDFVKYRRVSEQIFKILYDFTPEIEAISIDEAFLDITGSYHFYQTAKLTCQAIKKRIFDETKLTASIGIAPVKMVAKISSDLCKPDGLLEVLPGEVQAFLDPLKVEKLWGVGPKTKAVLNQQGVFTIGDLAKRSQEELTGSFGQSGLHLYELAHGIDPRSVDPSDEETKSVGHEHTFDTDTSDVELVHSVILALSEKVSRRLRKYDLKGRTLTMKVRIKGFKTYTRSHTFDHHVNLIDDIYPEAKKLFDEFNVDRNLIRLVGVRMTQFDEIYVQEDLFTDARLEKSEKVQQAMEALKDKFGEDVIHRGPQKFA